jgi:hypothetical protein
VGKVPETFEKFEWPWKKGEVDEERVAKLVWHARLDEETAENKVKELKTEVSTLQTQLDEAKASKQGTDADAQQTIKDLQTKVRELEQSNAELKTAKEKLESEGRPEDTLENARLSVALETGLSLSDAKRLVGKDRDELLADAKIFAEEHGIELLGDDDGDEGDDGDDDGGSQPPQRTPKPNLRTGAGSGKVKVASDPLKAAEALPPLW